MNPLTAWECGLMAIGFVGLAGASALRRWLDQQERIRQSRFLRAYKIAMDRQRRPR